MRSETQATTREQIAAIIVKYFPQILEHRQNQQIVTDVDAAWAREEIQIVVDTGLMDLFPNHTFEPSTLTTRGEFAVAMARLIRLLGLSPNDNPRIPTTDVVPTNTQYRDVQLVLGYAVMSVHDSGAFDISGELPGREAVVAAERLLKTFQQSQH